MKSFTLKLLIISLLLFAPIVLSAQSGNGKIAETIDAGGYIYLRLEDPELWIATRPVSASTGDQVSFSGGVEMKDFYSKSLDRTFESIFFVQNVSLGGAETAEASPAVAGSQERRHPTVASQSSVLTPATGEIPSLSGGMTIADIFAEAENLDDQEIGLRARVMKVSPNIMGKNWITLQDGTGTEPDHKLMATSSQLATPGDLVVVKGTLKKDIDIGAGYKYKVLLEQATFSVNSESGD